MVVSLVTVPITTRLLMPQEFGKSALFTVVVALLIRLVLLGADQSFVRKYFEQPSRQGLRKLLWSSLFTPLTLAFVVLLLIYAFRTEVANYLIEENDLRVAYMLMATTFVGFLDTFSINVVRMAKKAKAFSALNIVRAIIQMSAVISYAIWIEPSFYAVLVSVFLGHLCSLILGIWLEQDIWFPNFRVDFQEIKELLTFGMPYVPTFLLIWLLQGMDSVALKEYSTFEQLGIYNAAFKLVALLNVAKASFIDFWIPVSLEHFEKNRDDRRFYARISFLVSFITFILSTAVLATAPFFIYLLGSEYRDSLYVMPFLIFVPLFNLLSELTGRGIGFMKRTKYNLYSAFWAALVNLILNFLLIPILGALGAAIGTAAAYFAFFYFKTYYSQVLFKIPFPLNLIFSSLAVVLFTCTSIVVFRPSGFLFSVSVSLCSTAIFILYNKGRRNKVLSILLYRPIMNHFFNTSKT